MITPTHQEALKIARDALEKISTTRFGWDGDCGVTSIADDALAATSQVEAATSEAVAWLLEDQGCRAPDDCEEFERVVLAKDIAPDELARFRKAGRAHALTLAALQALPDIPKNAAISWNGTTYHGIEEIYHRMEECEALHMWLDDKKVPRADDAAKEYSLVGRVMRILEAQALPSTEQVALIGGSQLGMATMRDLAMLVQRMGRALSKAAPDSPLPAQAMDFLKRKGLQGSPLRDDAPAAQAKPDLSGLKRYNVAPSLNNGYDWGVEIISASAGRFVEFDDIAALLAHPVAQAKPEGDVHA